MGKGDIKTKRGKITNGTYGARRPRPSNKKKMAVKPAPSKSKNKE